MILLALPILGMIACSVERDEGKSLRFQMLPSSITNIDFTNTLTETDTLNYFNYSYIYMGGGIAVGDYNNDSLPDLYFTGNMVRNKLYLNRGNLTFEDVTDKSNVGGDGRWMLGATICDINCDGLTDIYVSVSGKSRFCRNLLYVNQGIDQSGVPVFKEMAENYGIDDPGHSTQSTFLDYDNDGDLDLYVANYPMTPFKIPVFFYDQAMKNATPEHSDHLYRRNEDGSFTDVTAESGLLSYGLALSATVSDFNGDGYVDIYVSNDFASPDLFYINNGDGTFTNRATELLKQTSFYGMGTDIGDFNNDGLLDIIQVDMAPEDNRRAKENMSAMAPDQFYEMVDRGLQHQYMYNSLQLNNGTTGAVLPFFSNISRMSGLATTDWSWGALFVDMDNDGWKDVFITNGSRRDINNIDYFNKIDKSSYIKEASAAGDPLQKVRNMPSEPIANGVFKNKKDLTFANRTDAWGFSQKGFSNGVAYADLDNDGDLEIIINNIDNEAGIYKNLTSEKADNYYLQIQLIGTDQNPLGIGTKISVELEGFSQFYEHTLSRGYVSSMGPVINFGMAHEKKAKKIIVRWPDGQEQAFTDYPSNQKLTVYHKDSKPSKVSPKKSISTLFSEPPGVAPDFAHRENTYDDFQFEPLLPHKTSNFGPGIAVGDVNGDGLEDCFIGNATGYAAKLFLQQPDETFKAVTDPWHHDAPFEDIDASFFDADNDGDLDLYVVSGGNEFPANDTLYQDRLYINDGKANFRRAKNVLPAFHSSGSCVQAMDYDHDGDMDLFIGGRIVPRHYPYPADSYLLENIGTKDKPEFMDVTDRVVPELQNIGLVTAALWADIDGNQWEDLIITGEWMPVIAFKNDRGKFKKDTLIREIGWWFAIDSGDFDQDGDLDLIGGNLGLNYKYKANRIHTFDIYADDFDNNKRSDIVLGYYQGKKQYPVRGRQCSSQQIPGIARKFENYSAFASAELANIYTEKALSQALHYKVTNFASSYFENMGGGNFKTTSLPMPAQLSSINDFLVADFDADGYLDIAAAGNLYASEPETPRNDAGTGIYLKGNGQGSFAPIPSKITGFYLPGDVKSLAFLKTEAGRSILAGNNNDKLQLLRINR